jgi:hypothetical protein
VNINRANVVSLAVLGTSSLGAIGIRKPRILRVISLSGCLSPTIPLAMAGSFTSVLGSADAIPRYCSRDGKAMQRVQQAVTTANKPYGQYELNGWFRTD